ncbi:mRNA 3'-end-processing protein RNA14 [Ceratobasidium sp. AG-Ba]|nr:mRNA 3'-end-processing protein RNA14 [Ceratobasidium sp. AG-Ba]
MDRSPDAELQNAIFLDPNFVKNFLSPNAQQRNHVTTLLKSKLRASTLSKRAKNKEKLYGPLCQVLNTIGRAVDEVVDCGRATDGDGKLNEGHLGKNRDLRDHHPAFVDARTLPIGSHHDRMIGLKPDLIWFDDPTHHWETAKMTVEIQTGPTYLKAGMKQLTKYARAIFAHQPHRRHIYGIVICGWEATFVRFDRMGVLYSEPMDVRKEEFHAAFAGLVMLDDEAMGYDTAFTTRTNKDGKLEFYVTLPEEALAEQGDSRAVGNVGVDDAAGHSHTPAVPETQVSITLRSPSRLFKVIKRLCHREDIIGCATIVLLIQEVLRQGPLEPTAVEAGVRTRSRAKREQIEVNEELGTEYVLKLMWRDPNRPEEGHVLKQLVGVYGISQYIWHSDVYKKCNLLDCMRMTGVSCEGCLDRTPLRDQVCTRNGLTDLHLPRVKKQDGEGTEYAPVELGDPKEAHDSRRSRIYCRLLMSTVGSSLSTASSPRQLVGAIFDAIIGYWQLVNMGLLHRDISMGNVLLLPRANGYRKRTWGEQTPVYDNPDPELIESEKKLREILVQLDYPIGMLNDFDLFATCNRIGDELIDYIPPGDEYGIEEPALKRRRLDHRSTEPKQKIYPRIDIRIGTPMFWSLRVTEVQPGERYRHSFLDDLESFFWLLLWCVVEHVDLGKSQVSGNAEDMMNQLDQSWLGQLILTKSGLLDECTRESGAPMKSRLLSFQNEWASNPTMIDLILDLGSFFHEVDRTDIAQYSPAQIFEEVVYIVNQALLSFNKASSDEHAADSSPGLRS